MLASFRPDLNQNRQLQPNGNSQQVHQSYQQQYQQYLPPNQPYINHQVISSNPQQYQNAQYSHLGPHRISQHISANQQNVPGMRATSPPITISYNEAQRAASPHQGSIVKQVFQPINQQQPISYEQVPPTNISQPLLISNQVVSVPQQQIIQQPPQPQISSLPQQQTVLV